jgi:hypothetical protein
MVVLILLVLSILKPESVLGRPKSLVSSRSSFEKLLGASFPGKCPSRVSMKKA